MSRSAHIIEITVPANSCIKTESAILRGFSCPNCSGAREFYEQTGHDVWKTRQCSYCESTGKVKAEVSVIWTPDDK